MTASLVTVILVLLTHEEDPKDLDRRFGFYQEKTGSSDMEIDERVQSSPSWNR